MARTPKKKVPFSGVFSNANVHDAPVVEQDNMTSVIAKQGTGRRGMRAVTFADPQGSSDSHQVLGVFCYRHPVNGGVIWFDGNGDVHHGKTPS